MINHILHVWNTVSGLRFRACQFILEGLSLRYRLLGEWTVKPLFRRFQRACNVKYRARNLKHYRELRMSSRCQRRKRWAHTGDMSTNTCKYMHIYTYLRPCSITSAYLWALRYCTVLRLVQYIDTLSSRLSVSSRKLLFLRFLLCPTFPQIG